MKNLLKKFENKEPEVVFNWKDPETDAEGWTVINSLRGGAAGGIPPRIGGRHRDGMRARPHQRAGRRRLRDREPGGVVGGAAHRWDRRLPIGVRTRGRRRRARHDGRGGILLYLV